MKSRNLFTSPVLGITQSIMRCADAIVRLIGISAIGGYEIVQYMMVSPYLRADSDRENYISLVPVYSAVTRPIGKIGCDGPHQSVSSLDSVDNFTIGRSDADSLPG